MNPYELAEHFWTVRKDFTQLRVIHRLVCRDDHGFLAAVVAYEGKRYLWVRGGRLGDVAECQSEHERAVATWAANREDLVAAIGTEAYVQAQQLMSQDPAHITFNGSAKVIRRGDDVTAATVCRKCNHLYVVDYSERDDTLTLGGSQP